MLAPENLAARSAVLAVALALMIGCGAPVEEPAPEPFDPSQREFIGHLADLCGQIFPGATELVADETLPPADAKLAMTVKECSEKQVRIAFHVNQDTWSRTWVVTLKEEGLLLKHDHRNQDGTPQERTNYGGWATEGGLPTLQVFPADDETRELVPEAATNIWTLELNKEKQTFSYILTRFGEPRFRAVFDLTQGQPIEPAGDGA